MVTRKAFLVTGASGYLGSLIAATLLQREDVSLLLPVRSKHTVQSLQNQLAAELTALKANPACLDRAHIVPLPSTDQLDSLLPAFRRLDVQEVVHCAGSLSYHDEDSLRAGNIDLTAGLIELAREAGVERFTYVSTAFVSGLVDGLVPEALFQGQRNDPAAYMRSKRQAEWLVANSGIPYLIIRPAIVIGDSRDGRYPGKPFGLYQVWHSAERFATYRYMPVIHAIAPRIPLQVVHQDAFQSAFGAILDQQAANSVVHIASHEDRLPTVRNLWDLWLDGWARPQEVHYYDRLDHVPLDSMDRDQRLFVQFAASNIEISTHAWRFQTNHLDQLRESGLQYTDPDIASVRRCQERFTAASARIRKFVDTLNPQAAGETRITEHYST